MNKSQSLIFPYRKNGKWGYSNLNKEIVVPCIYKRVNTFYGGYAEVVLEFNKIGIIDSDGNEIIPPIFSFIHLVEGDGYFIVQDKNNKYGLYKKNKLCFECKYEYIAYKDDNLFLVNSDRRWRFVDLNQVDLFPNIELKSFVQPGPFSTRDYNELINRRILIHKYSDVSVYLDAQKVDLKYEVNHLNKLRTKNKLIFYFAYFTKGWKDDRFHSLIFYDSEFNIIHPNLIDSDVKIENIVHNDENDEFIIVDDEKGGSYFIDEEFKTIRKLEFKVLSKFSDGLAKASMIIDGKRRIGFINKKMEIIISFVFSETKSFKNGMCVVGKDGFWGIIDKMGDIIIPISYKNIGDIKDGKVAVQFEDDRWNSCGFINLSNQLISGREYVFNYGGPYFNEYGVAIVTKHRKGSGLINRSGIEILECKYNIEYFFNGFSVFGVSVGEETNYGVINYQGEIILEPKYKKIYSHISINGCELWYVETFDKSSGYVDQFGNEYWEN